MKISVALANYNHGHYIRDNFDGILAQTYQNWEMHVIDDASTDNSAEIIAEYAARDARIKQTYLKENVGAVKATRQAFLKTDGDLLYSTASDDYLINPQFFEMAVNAFEKHDIGGYSCRYTAKNIISNQDFEMPIPGGLYTPDLIRDAFFKQSIIMHGVSAIFKRSLMDGCFSITDDLHMVYEYLIGLYAVLRCKEGLLCSEDVVAVHRVGMDNYGNEPARKKIKDHASFEYLLKKSGLFDAEDKRWGGWRDQIIGRYCNQIVQTEVQVITPILTHLKSLHPKVRHHFGERFQNFIKIIEDSAAEVIQEDGEQSVQWAHKIFDEIASPLRG